MKWLLKQLRADLWTPEVAGVGLGLVFIFALWISHKTPGASGTFFSIAAIVGKPLTASNPANQFFASIYQPLTGGLNWQAYLLIGLFLGALVSALLAGKFKITLMPPEQWKTIYGPSVLKRWVLVFIGAIILEVGAGIAGGCTSGLALAGGVQLSPAAFLFIPGIFLSGAVVQLLIYREKY
jgi:uncharacterized membrane protein YedE/YeeE